MTASERHSGTSEARRAFTVEGADLTVVVSKRFSKGERLELACDGEDVRLDSLLLESLSWQRERGVLDDLIDGDTDIGSDPVPVTGGTAIEDVDSITVSNEYAHTTVSKVETDAGEALRIDTPGRGTAINLGAHTLAALAGVEDTFAFSVWFETPFGPEDTPIEGVL